MLLVRARCRCFSRAMALRLTGLSGSGAWESAGRSSPRVTRSKPREDDEGECETGLWWLLLLLGIKRAEADRLLDIPTMPRGGGGGGAAACQAAVRSCDGVEDGIICMLVHNGELS